MQTRFKTRKGKEGTKVEDKGRERKYRSVSVYWAEEQLVEEVSDPEYSSTDDEGSETSSDDEQQDSRETIDFCTILTINLDLYAEWHELNAAATITPRTRVSTRPTP